MSASRDPTPRFLAVQLIPALAAMNAPAVAAANTGHADLNTTLADLDRVAQATQGDIASLHVEKWKAGWKSGFLKDGAHKDQAQQAAGSLQRNLANALPGLIHDVQTSRGSLSATFQLYDDVSLVCEAVDSLIAATATQPAFATENESTTRAGAARAIQMTAPVNRPPEF